LKNSEERVQLNTKLNKVLIKPSITSF